MPDPNISGQALQDIFASGASKVIDVTGLKNPDPAVNQVMLDVRHRIVRGGPKLPKILRAQLRQLEIELTRLTEGEGKGEEAADTRGKAFAPFFPDPASDYAAQVVLARCRELLGRLYSE